MRVSGLLGLLGLVLAACSSPPAPHGEVVAEPMTTGDLLQSDVNRMATLEMRDNLHSLLLLADKLYRRNPAEWRKSDAPDREAALARVRQTVMEQQPWPALQGRHDIQALALALGPEFKGDRVAAFVVACADMLVVAHGDRIRFTLIDSLDAQKLYNAARNMEIAVWMLAHRRTAAGQPLLLADEMAAGERNLSFEREFGKVIARLDLMSSVAAEKYRRSVIGYVQNLAGGTFFQFLPVR